MKEVDTNFTLGQMADIFAKSLTFILKDNQGICMIYINEKVVVYRKDTTLGIMKLDSDKTKAIKEGDLLSIESIMDSSIN